MIISDFRRQRMDNKDNKNNPNHNRQGWGIILITTLLVTFMVMGFYSLMSGSGSEEITYNEFLTMLDDGDVQKVTLNSDRIYITLTDEARSEKLQSTAGTDSSGSLMGQLEQQVQSQTGNTETEHDPDYYTGYV